MRIVTGKNKYADAPYNLPGCEESSGKIMKHRLVAQQILKRTLKNKERVIHKDGDLSNCNVDNIIVIANQAGVRRWYSKNQQEFLFRHDDGVYDYDWKKIKELQKKAEENKTTRKGYSDEKIEEIRRFVLENPEIKPKEIAEHFNISKNNIYKFLKYHGIKEGRGKNNLLFMSRKKLIDMFKHYSKVEDFANSLNVKKDCLSSLLKRRGIGRTIKAFKWLDENELRDAISYKYSLKELCELFDTFEENIMLNLKRYNIKTRFSSFALSEYYEDQEEIYNIHTENNEQEEADNICLDDVCIGYDEETKEGTDYASIENNEQDIKEDTQQVQSIEKVSYNAHEFCEKYNIHLHDLSFLTGKSLFEIAMYGISIEQDKIHDIEQTIDKIHDARKILTPYNVIVLFKNNNSTVIIAKIYNIPVNIVNHVIEHL